MIRSPGLTRANRSSLNRCRVSAVDGRCNVRKSATAQTSSSESSSTPMPSATSCAMNGSCATTRMPNALARGATSWPMRPNPAMPSVFPRSSVPRNRFFSHLPCFMARSAAGTARASASISAHACSATLMLLAPGALTTRMPRALAAATSMLSTPVPARATMRRLGAAASRSGVTWVALRTIRASASARAWMRSAAGRPLRASTCQPDSERSSSRADSGRSSATTIFRFALFQVRGCARSSGRSRALSRSFCRRSRASPCPSRRRG